MAAPTRLSVPEMADGGYWYVVDAETQVDGSRTAPSPTDSSEWAAWDIGGGMLLVRYTSPQPGLVSARVLAGLHKPHARIRGR